MLCFMLGIDSFLVMFVNCRRNWIPILRCLNLFKSRKYKIQRSLFYIQLPVRNIRNHDSAFFNMINLEIMVDTQIYVTLILDTEITLQLIRPFPHLRLTTGTHEFTPSFCWGLCCTIFGLLCNVLQIVACRFSFGLLCFLSFFDLRFLITPLVSSNFLSSTTLDSTR